MNGSLGEALAKREKGEKETPLAKAQESDIDTATVGPAEISAALDIMDVLNGGGYMSGPASESDSKVEKATREAARKAKAEMLAKALKAFFLIVDDD